MFSQLTRRRLLLPRLHRALRKQKCSILDELTSVFTGQPYNPVRHPGSYRKSKIQTLSTHLAAVSYTLAIFLLLGFAYYGWGRALSILLGVAKKTPENAAMPIWLGWAFTLFIFQALHFVLPITAYVVLPILVLGVAFSIPQAINALRVFPKRPCSLFLVTITGILFLGVSAWIASKAMLPPVNYDSGLYHFNTIRWINTYPIVPGLGNLHGRLAFNQSFFTYVAALNFYPFFGYGRSLANSFLMLLLAATVLLSLGSTFSRPALLAKKHPYLYVPDLLVLPIIGYLVLTSDGLPSPLPDLASTLLQLAMFVVLAHGIAEWLEGQREQDYRVIVLVVLAGTAVTIKLSNLGFSAVIFGISFAYAWQTSRPRIRGVARIILPVALLILVWGRRGFVLSGAPFFPSTIGYVPVDWAMPKENVVDVANWVYSWARQPDIHWSNVLGSWDWLRPWYRTIINQPKHRTDMVYPLAVFMAFCLSAIILTRRAKLRYLEWSILLPPMFGLIYWFVTAPEPRFAHAVFWLLSIGSPLLLLTALQRIVRQRFFWLSLVAVFVAGNLSALASVGYVLPYLESYGLKSISRSGWYPVQEVPLNEQTTDSGLVIYTPKEGNQCWDSPLPSTPDFKANLRLRTPGNIASGFTVARQ